MLISKVSEEGGAAGAEPEPAPGYRTASELFELMAKNAQFDSHDDDSLTARDLVLLYKNLDIGTKLMSDATCLPQRKPNQYVETIVYNDDLDSESDASEIYSSDDIQNVFMANQERLDFLNDRSLENLLCHKFGGMEINSSNSPADYDKNFLFKDPYIKNQLTNLNGAMNPCEFDGLFSTSLIDYICCKRLEDNYNFYMDNIIKYVQHTIEQLKRISNGDYLTDRTKEKWREVNSSDQQQENDTKVLATSTSIPLHVECKQAGIVSWDDIVHSEVDIRSLSKILEKKIVVEIPKLICGSYRLYSRQCSDNLIISCQRERREVEADNKGSRVDVVLQLQRSQSGQVMSNISSIMVLRTSPALSDIRANKILSLPYKEKKDEDDLMDAKVTVVELEQNTDARVTELEGENPNDMDIMPTQEPECYVESQNDGSCLESNDYPFSDRNISCDFASNHQSSESSLALRDTLDKPFFPVHVNELSYNKITTDELRITMHRLHKAVSVLEESGEDLSTPKRKSPVRVRIKSPYENKSFLMEEKKRKRLLEIRERREKKKLALSENRKISKHKYGKGAITPQASSSVTKLSITNKAFYNSIYGQTANVEEKPKSRQSQRSSTSDLSPKDESEALALTKKNNKKYINRSYYLDDTETEMMYMQMKLDNEAKDNQVLCSASNSFVSNGSHEEFDLLTQLIEPPDTKHINDQTHTVNTVCMPSHDVSFSREDSLVELTVTDITAPVNSDNEAQFSPKKGPSTGYECRKSIDQLYDLIKKFKKPKSPDTKVAMNANTGSSARGDVIIQGSESGTSVKHNNVPASNQSCCSAEKCNSSKAKTNRNQAAIAPKVVISSKVQSLKTEPEKTKKDRKFVFSPQYKGPPPDNPLKAISQLLHEFDNVQKTRRKPSPDVRAPKKAEIPYNDIKNKATQQNSYRRRSRLEQHLKDFEQVKKAPPTYHSSVTLRDKMRAKPSTPAELARNQPVHAGDRSGDKTAKKKIADIIDEAKEARGEAVRGPSKFSSRLNSLAQPKKSYVMANHEQYQHRYGRTVVGERLQRLAEATAPPAERSATSPSSKNRWKRNGSEVATVASAKLSSPPALHLDKGERGVRRTLRSTSSSPASTARRPGSGFLPAHGYLHHAHTHEHVGNKKMPALESSVQGRGGRAQSSGAALLAGLRSRIPLVPRDIELASSPSSPCVASMELGETLRQLVSAAVSGATVSGAAVSGGKLGALAECVDSGGRAISDSEDFAPPEDNLSTAVQAVRSGSELRDPLDALELEMLESALYSHISGAFQKRLRIKNLTLTPKHSVQRVFYLQSGDGGPSAGGSLHDLKAVPVLSGSDIDWSFACFPKQITTVGYMFPEYRDAATRGLAPPRRHEFSSQCFKGSPGEGCADSGAQVDITADVVVATVEDVGSQVTRSQMLIEVERMKEVANRTNSVQNFLKIEYVSNEEDTAVTTAVVVEDAEVDDVVVEVVLTEDGVEEHAAAEDVNYVEDDGAAGGAPSISPDYTTSLDMLVGILNEIQKITCQEAVPAAVGTSSAGIGSVVEKVAEASFKRQDKTAPRDLISLATLDNLRQLESSTSIYSRNLSSATSTSDRKLGRALNGNTVAERIDESTDTQQLSADRLTIDEIVSRQMMALGDLARVDKQISADVLCGNYVDICTEVPSSLLPVMVSRSATVSACVLRPPDTPSALSVYSMADSQIFYADALLSPPLESNIELPKIEVKDCVRIPRHLNKLRVRHEKCPVRSELRKYCVKNIDLDPMLRLKRDVLVTMYSILVFTVFAALSFPELLKFQS